MPRKRSRQDGKDRWFTELETANMGPYTILLYETWIGDRTDIRTEVEEWMSVFFTDKLDEICPVEEWPMAKAIKGIKPYIWEEKSYYSYFEGLSGAENSMNMRKTQESDEEAASYARIQEDQREQVVGGWGYGEEKIMGNTPYGEFLDRIDEVDPNNPDDPIWDTLNEFLNARAARMENV